MAQLHERRHLLAKGLVAANGLAAVEVAINTRINLVQEVGLVRPSSVSGRAGGVAAAEHSMAISAMGTSRTRRARYMSAGRVGVGSRHVGASGVGVGSGHVRPGSVTSSGTRGERRGVRVVRSTS